MNIPDDIKQYLDSNTDMIVNFLNKCKSRPYARCGLNVKYIKEIDCFIKFGVERVQNSKNLRNIIEKNNLNLLCVPDKYLYHMIGYPTELSNNNYIVVVRRIYGKSGRGALLDSMQVDQLYKLIILANYSSLVTANYIVMDNGKICIIDTDNEAINDNLKGQNPLSRLVEELTTARKNYHNETHKLFVSKIK